MQRLQRNQGAYRGETIDIAATLADIKAAATVAGWHQDKFGDDPELFALHRKAHENAPKLYLSTGIHGDEPAGPLAVLELLRENAWPDNADLWLCPCLNPTGFPLNTRESAEGVDLNRDYLSRRAAEVRAHIAWLEQQPRFDLCLCLHEDWEAHGFYVYELNPDHQPSLAERMVEAVRPVCPIDPSELIDGREAQAGIIRPNLDPTTRPEWPEAFYLYQQKCRLGYTLEAPSDFPLAARVAALVQATKAGVFL